LAALHKKALSKHNNNITKSKKRVAVKGGRHSNNLSVAGTKSVQQSSFTSETSRHKKRTTKAQKFNLGSDIAVSNNRIALLIIIFIFFSLTSNLVIYSYVNSKFTGFSFHDQLSTQSNILDSPLNISGVRVWYDATDITTLYTDKSCTTQVTTNNQDVKCWKDKSSYAHNATNVSGKGVPKYVTDQFNSLSILQFNTSESDTLRHVLDSNYTTNFSFFIVLKSTADSPSNNEAFFSNGDEAISDHFQIDYDSALDKFRLKPGGSAMYFGDFNNEIKLYGVTTDGSTITAYSEGVQTDIAYGRAGSRVFEQYRVNQNRAGNSYHDSQIAEIIIYNRSLTACEFEQVNEYLGDKYARDFQGIQQNYSYSSPHNNDITGIGNFSSECEDSATVTSATSSIATISSPSSLDLNDFLTFAHDNNGFTFTSEAPSGYNYSITRSWRVDVDNTPGTVSVSFDLSSTGISPGNYNYALLIDSDTDFSDAEAHTTGSSRSGNIVSFTLANFTNGEYFTLGLVEDPSSQEELTATGVTTLCINDRPSIDISACNPYAFFDTPYLCRVIGSDPSNHSILFSDNTSLFDIDSSTGIITFQPVSNQSGTHPILLTVTDDGGCGNLTQSAVLNISIISGETTPSAPNLTTSLINCSESNIILNWSNVSAEFYEIYYSDNFTFISDLNPYNLDANITNITNSFNWTDSSSSLKNYYKVVAVNELESINQTYKTASNIAGKFTVTAYQGSQLIISSPFNMTGKLLNETICPPQTAHNSSRSADKIRVFYGNNLQKYAYWFGSDYGWYSFSDPQLENLELNYGYLLHPINQTYNITLTGPLALSTQAILNITQNSVNTIGISYPLYYNLSTAIAPAQTYCGATGCADKIRVYYGEDQQKYSYWFGSALNWYSASTPELNYIEPGYGYYLYPINQSYTETINFSDGELI